MLECGKNYKGTMSEMCRYCDELDDETHRMNNCMHWDTINRASNNEKIDFHDIYSNEEAVLTEIIVNINNVWEIRFANGKMKTI